MATAWVLAAAAAGGCLSGGRGSALPGPAGGAAEVVYEVGGEAALTLAVGLAGREAGPAVLPAGHVAETEPRATDGAGGDRRSRDLHGRLELVPSRGGVIARVTVYESPRKAARVASSKKQEPAAPRRGDVGEGNADRAATRPPALRQLAAYELELPGAELEFVLDDLDAAGAFSAPERPGGGTRLTLGAGAAKEWTPEPRLDDLAERVLREGRLVPRRLPGGAGSARVKTARVKAPGA